MTRHETLPESTVDGETAVALGARANRLQEALAESERIREELARSLSGLTAALESTTDGLLVVDRQGRMTQMNSNFINLWRIPQEIQDARDDNRAIAVVLEQLKDPEQFLTKIRELYGAADAESFDLLDFKDGRVFERYSLPQRVGGEIVGRVWTFRDITERRRLENQLRQSQKMEGVGHLAGGVAHDFNNLLTVIGAHASFLIESLDAASPEREDAAAIFKATGQAAGLTRQLLAFSRKQLLQMVAIDLNAVVIEIEPMLRRLIGEDVAIVTSLSPHLGVATTDRGQMEQTLVNLVVNARDAMPTGGRIQIATANVVLDQAFAPVRSGVMPAGAYVRLSVSDTGVGIPPDNRDRIFEPFFTTKEVGRGTGLGLSTVYGIVKQSNGFVWLDSEVGAGSTFSVYLPKVSVAPMETPTLPHLPIKLEGSETILVAEDDGAVRELVCRVLGGRGYTVLHARNGADALRVAEEHSGTISLLVTDIVMPGISGVELGERLRRARPGIGSLYMSGYTAGEIDRRGTLPSDAILLDKPFTGTGLAIAVRAALDTRGSHQGPFRPSLWPLGTPTNQAL